MHKALVPFSERLNEAMALRGKRQVDLCRDLGLNKGTMSGYVSGAHTPDASVIIRLAKYFRVDPVWLTGFDVPFKESSATAEAVGGLSELEVSLLEKFRQLNSLGTNYLMEQLDYALSKEKYVKKGDVVESESA